MDLEAYVVVRDAFESADQDWETCLVFYAGASLKLLTASLEFFS